jgi:hypothetical protein
MGALLKNYFAIGHDSLDNYIAQISGQAPDPATQNDCGKWTRFKPANHQSFCDQHILSFQPLLHDLASARSTPAFSWLSPNLCMDGHDAPCGTGDPRLPVTQCHIDRVQGDRAG